MNPTSTERQLSRTQVTKYRKADPALYLRTYDVISSLDRAQNTPRWEKAFAAVSRLRNSLQTRASRVSAPKAGRLLAAPREPAQLPTTTLVAQRRIELVAQRPVEDRSVSWVLLAVVAMVTAGVTFAVIHFARPSVEPGNGWPHHKRVSSFVTTRSQVLPRLFLRLRTISES